MEKLSTTSKLVSAGAILVLGMGISAAVMTSSANADESHSIPKIAHISQSASVIPPGILPSTIKAPSMSGIGSEDDSEGSSLENSSSDDSSEGSGTSTGISFTNSDD